MRKSIEIHLSETKSYPADFQNILDVIKAQLDAGFRAITTALKKDGIELHQLDNNDMIIEIVFEEPGAKIILRKKEKDDKLPYKSYITFPCIGALKAFATEE